MSPESIQSWEQLLAGIDKQKIPVEFIKKIVLRLHGKKQRTINIAKYLEQGLDPELIEENIERQLIMLDPTIIGVEFILNVEAIVDTVQPETDRLLNRPR